MHALLNKKKLGSTYVRKMNFQKQKENFFCFYSIVYFWSVYILYSYLRLLFFPSGHTIFVQSSY